MTPARAAAGLPRRHGWRPWMLLPAVPLALLALCLAIAAAPVLLPLAIGGLIAMVAIRPRRGPRRAPYNRRRRGRPLAPPSRAYHATRKTVPRTRRP